MRRLSIIDLGGGHQPISNEDGSVWIVFNGEIYNYRELRDRLTGRGHRFRTQSDTEVVVHGYEEWGVDAFLSQLNGMFALALWDRRRRRLTLARDRVGIKPLHYAVLPDRLLFGSEIKALTADRVLPRRIDLQALREYVSFEYVPTPRSILEGLRKLPPGHLLTYEPDREAQPLVTRWWDLDLAPSELDPEGGLDACARGVRDALRTAVRREMVSDVDLGVFLSGGVDSSAVAAMMTEVAPGEVNSFSIGFEDPSFDESGYARRVAAHLNTRHRELVLGARDLEDLVPRITELLDEPMADASIVPTFLLCRFTREHVKVALGGDGGDELFAGYPTVKAHRLAGYYRRLPLAVRHRMIRPAVNRLPVNMDNLSFDYRAKRFVAGAEHDLGDRHLRWMGSFTPEEAAALLAPDIARLPADAVLAHHLAHQAQRDPLNQVLYLDMKLYLENDILVKLDRASMMNSLEARVPLLNAEFVEHVARLPVSVKLRGLSSKYILRRALRGLIPDEVIDRPKKGFGIPVGKWFRGPLRELLLDTLNRDKVVSQGFFQWAAVDALISAHMSGRRDHRKELWTLFTFQRWYDTHMAVAPPLAATASGGAV
jgi:asparagine synthase (glutamine-hydrolysing)